MWKIENCTLKFYISKKKTNNKSVNWKYKEPSGKGFKYKFYILIVGKRKFTIACTTYSHSLRISLIFTYMYINLAFHRTGALWNPPRFAMDTSATIRTIFNSFIRSLVSSRKNYITKIAKIPNRHSSVRSIFNSCFFLSSL